VQYARDRPVGYDRDGLVIMETTTSDLHDHFNALRNDLIASGAVVEIAESSSPTTGVNNDRADVEWEGKDPSLNGGFGSVRVTTGYGKTVGWQFAAGRDFSSQLATDSSAVVLNEAAVAYMGLKDPVGKTIRFKKRDHLVIGVIRNMVMQSPYKPVKQALFFLASQDVEYINIKINPGHECP
jgi:putative ABC transport system permease protein